MKKNKLPIITNILLVLLETIGLIITYIVNKKIPIEYYTELSNIFSLIITIIYLYYLFNNKKITKLIQLLKYTSVLCLTITFIIVIFVLAPMDNFNYKWFLFNGDFIFYHFLCPILSFISFMFIEKYDKFTFKDNIRSLYPTFIYSIVLVILNIIGLITGPYPFLEVRNNSIITSLIWFIILISFMFGLSNLLTYLKNKTRYN